MVTNSSANSTGTNLNDIGETEHGDGYSDVDFLLRSIWIYAGYPILVLGTVGHLLVIILLLLNKRMRSLPLSLLLLTMSASGLTALYVGLLPTIYKHHTGRNELFDDQTTEGGCPLLMATIYFSFQLYSWMEASVAVERMCAVRWALTHRTLSMRSVNIVVVTCIVMVLMAINGIHFKIFGMSDSACNSIDEELFQTWQYVHSVVYIIFPMVVMFPANVVTLHTIYRSPLKNSTNVKKAKPVAITMFILNGIFVVTTVPILVGNYEDLGKSEFDAARVAWAASRLAMYLGCSMTFLVYVAVAAKFRKALLELLLSAKKKTCFAVVATSDISSSRKAGGSKTDRVSASINSTIAYSANSFTKSTTDRKY